MSTSARERLHLAALKFYWLYSDKTADHGIAPTIRIKDTLMGTDKWEHFFQQGYWHFDQKLNEKQAEAYGLWLEGHSSARGYFFEANPEYKDKMKNMSPPDRHAAVDFYYEKMTKKYGVSSFMGIYGSLSTGIISRADINANIAGMQFYKKIFAAYQPGQEKYPFSFSVNDYQITGFNEQNVQNTFVPGLKVNDNK